MSNLMSQNLAGEYYISDKGGEIVLRLQYSGPNQITGTMTDMQGVVYQVEATEEDGDAFGTLRTQQGGMYFEAFREVDQLIFTLIPPGADGQPNNAGAQDFYMAIRGQEVNTLNNKPIEPKTPTDPLMGRTSTNLTSSWAGTFSGNVGKSPSQLSLQLQGNQIGGILDVSGYKYQLGGQVSGPQAQGQFVDMQTRGAMSFQGSLAGDQLTIVVTNSMNGQSATYQFQRGALQSGGFTQPSSGISQQKTGKLAKDAGGDQRIAGSWISSQSYSSGDFGFASQIKLVINPNGTFIMGDAKIAGGGPGIGGSSSGGGETTQGQWKTQNNNVILVNGGNGWTPYCRYETNGQSLLMYFGDGSKQLWKRSY